MTESLPGNVFANAEFDLEEYMSTNKLVGGATDVHEVAPRRWKAFYQTRWLNKDAVRAWKAFKDRQRGGLIKFYGYDPERIYPQAYPTGFGGLTRFGGGAFDGTTTVTSLGAFSIDIATLPVGLVIQAGDLFGLIEGNYRGLFEVSTDVTADAGGAATLAVEPDISSVFTTSAQGNFYRPVCTMKIDETSWNAPRNPSGGSVSFNAIEMLT